ncbi:MAG: adenylate cyclase [Gammaproteobacteria bacterium]|jgi:adenylate cyclase
MRMSDDRLTSSAVTDDQDALATIAHIFERRYTEGILKQTVSVFPEHEREQLIEQIDDLGRRLDSLVEATSKAREPLSFDVLLTWLMTLVTEAFDADRSSLFLHDAEAHELYSRVAQGELAGELRFPADAGIAGMVFQSGEPAIINNAYADTRFNSTIDADTGYHTHNILCVPLRTRAGQIIGVTEVLNKCNGDFTTTDCALLRAFTTHTAAAIEATQLTERARDAQREEAQILEVSRAVSSELDIDKLLRRIIATASDLLDAERSTLFVHDASTQTLWSRVAEGLSEREIRIPANVGIAGEVFTTRRAVNIPDAYADERFNSEVDRKTGYRTRSILCVPVVNKFDVAIGVVQVLNRRGGPFRARDQLRLEMLAAQSAIALDNARLFREVLDERNYNENVLRSLSDGVITLDTFGNIVKLNEAATRLLRVDAQDVLGAAANKVFGTGNEWILESVQKVVARRVVESVLDRTLCTHDQQHIPVNLTVAPLADTQGEALGETLILEDITQDKRMRATMARYMTAEVAEQVLAEGDSALGGRSTAATVLFSDIEGFSAIAERLGPQDTVSMLNEYFTEMVEVVFEYNGILDKYIGDAIMAVFGTPYPSPDDADNAVRVAIRMQQVLADLNRVRRESGRPSFEVRIGINSGDVVVGNIGSSRRMDYTVIGDGVNTAARLESANKQLGTRILISGSTRESLRGDYRLRELDLIRVKGRVAPVPIYEVRGLCDESAPTNELRLLEAFCEAQVSYRKREWSLAIAHFERALALDPTDQPSALLRRRAMHHLDFEPHEDWDGVWSLTEK